MYHSVKGLIERKVFARPKKASIRCWLFNIKGDPDTVSQPVGECSFWSFLLIFQKSFQKTPPIFGHFLIFQCKLARCFQKHLHFWPLVSLQRKSSRNLTLFSGNFVKWILFLRPGQKIDKCAEVSIDGATCPNFIVIYLWNEGPREKKSRGLIC